MTQKQSESPDQNPEHKRLLAASKASIAREKQALELQRERILSERTANPHRRAALVSALADVESKLETLA